MAYIHYKPYKEFLLMQNASSYKTLIPVFKSTLTQISNIHGPDFIKPIIYSRMFFSFRVCLKYAPIVYFEIQKQNIIIWFGLFVLAVENKEILNNEFQKKKLIMGFITRSGLINEKHCYLKKLESNFAQIWAVRIMQDDICMVWS
ncbi:hypothetical protein PHYBLDRAFT_170717 [Phycomyces blakesleeanus NRRL 1555(-)]|uniref:Uncharacterized protein n=1 Tax=Phycomyces blakesleeanus (strain ATCC 8743b / DSM 1359 / FGSC 10004 / NBRC 33097 / NRRL 1555) TaxID=763407 RepID=A0A162U0J9_PHYB8|nr:hypothetical protein PHYBLDRAFT_170717 [Phycomyces blakesleeanus NRRL 1555(-)]OAD71353.1 hypothetical protein PHYBLDRAFT_170717 [Phycomyces blakesleeanus NRRL 1555(-)]|eukprot:XP_018289393.1 hypothetical protein PHYBLDRAFT_170717 [Phycomyces blakesleeanus NRRL 1555(-)]